VDARDVDVLLLLSSHLQTGNWDMERPKRGSLSLCWGRGEEGVSREGAAVLKRAVFKFLVYRALRLLVLTSKTKINDLPTIGWGDVKD